MVTKTEKKGESYVREVEFQYKIGELLLDALICFRLALKYDDNYHDLM